MLFHKNANVNNAVKKHYFLFPCLSVLPSRLSCSLVLKRSLGDTLQVPWEKEEKRCETMNNMTTRMMATSTKYSGCCLLFLGLLCLSSVVGLQHGKGAEVYGAAQPKAGSSLPQPFFDTMIDPDTGQGGRNVTTAEGGKSLLFCTIRHLGKNNTVSWIKKARHPVVMSSGTAVFTSDRRVRIRAAPDTWILQIDPVLAKDDGLYECQVNTRNTMSLTFKLNVEPAHAQIHGEAAVYVKVGSTISLTCTINLYSVPPPDITWYHGSKVLNFDSPRGGISLETEKTRTGTTSKLLVTRATEADSGSYTCDPSRGQPKSADVHIITDEQPAELQDGLTSGSRGQHGGQLIKLLFTFATFNVLKHATSPFPRLQW